MEKFTTLQAVAAAFLRANIDTDLIIPKQFLKTTTKTGLGSALFFEARYDDDGNPLSDFCLNRPGWEKSGILVAGSNFGCGSSREHAPWALYDFGIRCVIAPSFADIFYNNCFNNAILPIALPEADWQTVVDFVSASDMPQELLVNLPEQNIRCGHGQVINFTIEPSLKHRLLEGLDQIGLTLLKAAEISNFEAQQKQINPWLYRTLD